MPLTGEASLVLPNGASTDSTLDRHLYLHKAFSACVLFYTGNNDASTLCYYNVNNFVEQRLASL